MMTYEEQMFVEWVNQTSAYDSANIHQRWMKDAYVAGYQKASKNYTDELETKSQEWEKALDALDQRWEDASRCVPEPYLNVLTVDATNPRPRYDVGYIGSDGVWKGQNSISSMRVTHWQPLPGVAVLAKQQEAKCENT